MSELCAPQQLGSQADILPAGPATNSGASRPGNKQWGQLACCAGRLHLNLSCYADCCCQRCRCCLCRDTSVGLAAEVAKRRSQPATGAAGGSKQQQVAAGGARPGQGAAAAGQQNGGSGGKADLKLLVANLKRKSVQAQGASGKPAAAAAAAAGSAGGKPKKKKQKM